ncbi:hypothetical protein CEXT_304581 [Caerostris extrusa]|uniref:Uncharacterized protein n=1 Tax=Caerostris extrusa TaxID=172846 RepID=A0AAV4YE05_CAEEX|nr:hypothetical protein CEXT_304581 [Caerostris extrusa]
MQLRMRLPERFECARLCGKEVFSFRSNGSVPFVASDVLFIIAIVCLIKVVSGNIRLSFSYLLFPKCCATQSRYTKALMTCVGSREICRRALKCALMVTAAVAFLEGNPNTPRNLWVFLSASGQAHDAIRDRGCTERFECARLCGKGGVFVSL